MEIIQRLAARFFIYQKCDVGAEESLYLKELRKITGTIEETQNVRRLGKLFQASSSRVDPPE